MQDGDARDPVVQAAADQLNAEAIERLKGNRLFALITPSKMDGEEALTFMFSGPIHMMVEMHHMITRQLTLYAAKDFLASIEADEGHAERDILHEYLNLKMEKKGGESDSAR